MTAKTPFRAPTWAQWYMMNISIWLFLLLHVNCEPWNGCVDFEPLIGVSTCYQIHYSISGYEAWKKCIPLETEYIPQAMENKHRTYSPKKLSDVQFLWMGAIQAYPGSNTYVRYNEIVNNLELEGDAEDYTFEMCFALDMSSLPKTRYVKRNCNESLPMICKAQIKFRAYAYNASAPEACNNSNALSLLPNTGCYVHDENCSRYSVAVREEWHMFDSLTNVTKNSLAVVILEIRSKENTLTKKGETLINSTNLCYNGSGNFKKIKLHLKRSAGELRLWVGNVGRAEWPPECVGGEVDQSDDADPRALLVTLNRTDPHMPHLIWCYTKDIVNGAIVLSNRILIPGNVSDEIFDTCPDTNGTTGPPPGTTIDHNASCLNCFEQSLNRCLMDPKNCTSCTKSQCGPYGLQFSKWNSVQINKGNFEEFRECAESSRCTREVLWKLSEGGDCDGDGVFDCDDRLLRSFSPDCSLRAGDPRFKEEFQRYWNCTTNPLRDFVDLPVGNQIARYFCENHLNKGRTWSGPQYILEEMSFYLPTTEISVVTTKTPEQIEKEAIDELNSTTEELRTLQFVTLKLPPNESLTVNETEEIISNFSRLFDVSESVLRNAQQEAKVSSLPELLESILIRAPSNLSYTTSNIAVNKKQAIGFQLISDKPLDGLERFGKNPKQIPISSPGEIKAKQVEAAVILPKIREETTMVVVTFSKGSDFTSCYGPANFRKKNRTVTYRMSFDSSNPIHEPTHPNHMESIENEEFKLERNCSYHDDLVRGCINTHVVQVGLLDSNGSYVQLHQGESVKILLRTKIVPMLGQTKKCVYWKPHEGGWASDGCKLTEEKDGLDTCRCSHLTHFAEIVSDAEVIVGPHKNLLNTISIFACMISLVGFAGVILAGVLVKNWRKKLENKVMLNLAVAMSLFMGLFLWASLTSNLRQPVQNGHCPVQEKLSVQCQVAGAILHYSVLCSFCWMLVASVTHYLRFTTFTGADGIPRFVLKSSFVGWGFPIIPVVVLVVAEPGTYAGRGRDFCYPTGIAFYGSVLTPILLIMLTNMIVFVMILRVLFPRCRVFTSVPQRPQRFGYNERRDLIRRMIICVAFTFLFGLTWYLGLLSFTVWPAYVFCGVMAIHGPALLLFFVFGEESIRNKLWGKKKSVRKMEVESTSGFTGSTTSTNMLTMTSPTNSRDRTRRILPSAAVYVVSGNNACQYKSKLPGM